MNDHSLKPVIQKLLAFWLAFIALHFAYDFFPSPFLAVFSGTSETVAQHIKMSYFAYTFVSLWNISFVESNLNRGCNF